MNYFRRYTPGGEVALPVIVNACVHVVMYSYYGLAAMHIQRKNLARVKLFVTTIQVKKFCLTKKFCMYFCIYIYIDQSIYCCCNWMYVSFLCHVH